MIEDRQLQKYYEEMFTLFRTEGWKELMGDLKTQSSNIDSVRSTVDERDLNFRKGQLDVLSYMLTLESQLRDAEEALSQPNEE